VINIYRQTLAAGPGASGPARPADIGPDAGRLWGSASPPAGGAESWWKL
jgi:hypothetical protein